MKKALYLVVLVLVSVSVLAIDKYDFVQMVENTDYCFDCYTIYKITKATSDPLQNLEINFKDDKGDTIGRNLELFIQQDEIKNSTEPIMGPCPQTASQQTNETPYPSEQCYLGEQQVQKIKKTFKAASINGFYGLYNSASVGTQFLIKISGKLGKEEAIDNILTFNQYTYPEYAWWNSSFSSRLPINCSNVEHGIPIVVNGKNGFDISGQNQIVWTLCSHANLSVYYNNNNDYVVANDTGQVPFDVEKGTRNGVNAADVWSKYRAVYHYNQTTGTSLPDSTTNAYTATFTQGNGWTTSGQIGSAYSFNGVNDYASRGSILSTTPTNYSFITWVYPVDWTSSSSPALYNHQEANRIRNIIYRSGTTVRSLVNVGSDTEATHPYTNISTGTWHLIASVWNGTHNLLYLNGTQFAAVSASGSFSGGGANPIFNLGSNQGIGGYYFKGYLDETRFTTTTLTGSQQTQMYQNALGTSGYGNVGASEMNLASETDGRLAIEQGVQQSELQTFAFNTDHQLTIRLLNGSQYTGTFDKFVLSGNKRWAFNYDPDSPAGFPAFVNLTPTFHVLQIYNKTFEEIRVSVSGFVNATN